MGLFDLFARRDRREVSTAGEVSKVKERLLKDRMIFLGLPINDATANDVIARLLFLERESATKPIRLLINSPGGVVVAGLAIMDTMDKVRAPISTHCMGTAHSLAAVIMAYGHFGLRTAQANSTFTFTLPEAPDDADLEKKKEAERLGEILIAKTAAATKRSTGEIRHYFHNGTSFSAENAVASGIVDRVTRV